MKSDLLWSFEGPCGPSNQSSDSRGQKVPKGKIYFLLALALCGTRWSLKCSDHLRDQIVPQARIRLFWLRHFEGPDGPSNEIKLSDRLRDHMVPQILRTRSSEPWARYRRLWVMNHNFNDLFTELNLYEHVSLSSRKISACNCLWLSLVGSVFLRCVAELNAPISSN